MGDSCDTERFWQGIMGESRDTEQCWQGRMGESCDIEQGGWVSHVTLNREDG